MNFEVWNNHGECMQKPDVVKKLRQETRGRAIIDSGATSCVAGIAALEDLQMSWHTDSGAI